MAETLTFNVLGRGDASDVEKLAAAIDNLTNDLRKLDRTKANPKVDVDTANAERKVGKFADTLQRNITRAIEALPEVDLDADATDAQREIAAIRADLQSLDGQRIGVDIDAVEAERQLRALQDRLQRLSTESADIAVQADTTAAIAALGLVNREVDKIDGRTAQVKVKVDRGLGDTIVQIAALGRALSALSVPAALVAAAPQIAALGAAAMSAVGAVGLLPGILAAAAAGAGALSVGMHAVGDALGPTGTPAQLKKVREAFASLAPAAKEFVTAVRGVGAAWRDVRLDVQQRLFAGLGVEMRQLSSAYLPTMRVGLGGVADAFNDIATNLSNFATEADTVRDVDSIFRNTTAALREATPAASNLFAAFLDIAKVGSDMLPELADGLTAATGRFRSFIAEARQSGQLREWIQQGIDTLQTLGSIAGNVGSILGSVFKAAEQSGADLLTRLDEMTEAAAEFMRSGEGQSALVAAFAEIRDVIDEVQPGLATLARAAAEAVKAFAATDGLQRAGEAFSDIAAAVAPLIPRLAQLAGDTLGMLADAVSNAAKAFAPLISWLSDFLGLLGPVVPAVAAMVLAFRGLAGIGGGIAKLGTILAGLGTRVGASEGATSKLATAFGRLGSAVPIAGAALVAVSLVYDQLRSKVEDNARAVAEGNMTMGQAIQQNTKQLETQQAVWEGLQGEGYATGKAIGELTGHIDTNAESTARAAEAARQQEEAWKTYRATLTPMAALQADVNRAQGEYLDAVRDLGPTSDAAGSAAGRLSSANERLRDAQESASEAAKTHEDRLRDLADTMASQIGTALAYEEAVRRTGDALDDANEALKKHGAQSEQYKEAVLNAAQAVEQQASAARRAAEATHGAEAGTKAYNDELLKVDRSSQAGRDTFAKLAMALDDTGLSALTAQAEMSGLKTEVITLPDGRKVTVVVNSEREQLDTVARDLEEIERRKYVGTVTILGDPKPFQDGFLQAVQLADGTTAMLKLDADKKPLEIVVDGAVYEIDQRTGTMKIKGDPAPGEADLSGFKVKVDSETGVVSIEADPVSALATHLNTLGTINTSKGTVTILGDATHANGQVSATVQFANGETGVITFDGDNIPADGKVTASVRYADGSTGTVTVNARDLVTPVVDRLKRPTSSTHTITVVQRVQNATRVPLQYGSGFDAAGGGVVGYSGGGVAGRPVRASRGAVLPGYAPGRDTVPALLSRGESVLVPELTRALGARRIMAANRAASGGRRATVVGRIAGLMDGSVDRRGFAGGGLTLRPQFALPLGGAASSGGFDRLATEIRSLLALVQQRLGPTQITVEDRSGDPVATARATQMAIRMAR